MKICSSCKIFKESSFFSADKRTSTGLQSKCKPCQALYAKERRAKNPEKHREAVKKSTAKNYAKKLMRNQKYRHENPEKVFVWKKLDRFRNKQRILSDNAKRRSMIDSVKNERILALYCLRDFYEAMSLGDRFHVDHIVPLSRGGKHEITNLQVIPAIDNLRKGSKIIDMRGKK